jgi:1,4-dihydroxy-6-naphthoate synthase
MKVTLGFSPCPNDTFIFDALVNEKIDTEGLDFDVVLEDVQTLNQWADEGRLDVTKLSFPALFNNLNKYVCLDTGAALGKGVGPLLIAKTMVNVPDISHCRIAIPGINTTANFLLSHAFPMASNRIAMVFSDIETAVLNGDADMGVIIHENRFTYQQKGLVKILDLGEHWEAKTGTAIPLGCIAAKHTLSNDVVQKINRLIRSSLQYAYTHYPEIAEYVKEHAQEMNEQVMRQHIELYVNEFTMDLGEMGKEAIHTFYKVFTQSEESSASSIFIQSEEV